MKLTLKLKFRNSEDLRNVLAVYELLNREPNASLDDLPYAIECMSDALRDWDRTDIADYHILNDGNMSILDGLANMFSSVKWGEDEEEDEAEDNATV
jgi:hypothetical protein